MSDIIGACVREMHKGCGAIGAERSRFAVFRRIDGIGKAEGMQSKSRKNKSDFLAYLCESC